MPDTLTRRIVPAGDLTPADADAMYDLFRQYFEVDDPALFRRDLREKQWAILLTEPDTGRLGGFSTMDAYATCFRDRQIGVVYSGDTIMAADHWGTSALPQAWIETVTRIAPGLPQPLYWFLISSGYRTYRFLNVFFREFHPRHDLPAPPGVRALIDHLGASRFGPRYDAGTGIVRFGRGATPLRRGVSEIDERRLRDPHVRYFVERNPGHGEGDELACLAELRDDNLTPAALRILRIAGIEHIGEPGVEHAAVEHAAVEHAAVEHVA